MRFLRELAARALGRSGPLVLSRATSAMLTFALPLVLVRILSPGSFGLYKQFFLLAQTLLLVGQVGLTQSLYYFLPRGGRERGSYVTHAVIALALLGAAAGVGLYLAAPLLGRWMDPALEPLRLPLALYAGAMLAAAPLEGALTSDGRIGGAALAYLLSDAVRAGAFICGGLMGGALGLFWAAVGVGWLRVTALGVLLVRGTLPVARPDARLLREQLAFSLPFAGAIWLYVGQRYFAQYAVSARFSAATFALFTVASFHLPVVDIVFTPITEVLMVELGRAFGVSASRARGRGSAVVAQWDDALDKLASMMLPAACGAWLFGPTVLPIIFTAQYRAAVPLFLLATVEIPLWILPCDALLRAAGDTRFLFGFNAARIVLTAACVLSGIHFFGLAERDRRRNRVGGAGARRHAGAWAQVSRRALRRPARPRRARPHRAGRGAGLPAGGRHRALPLAGRRAPDPGRGWLRGDLLRPARALPQRSAPIRRAHPRPRYVNIDIGSFHSGRDPYVNIDIGQWRGWRPVISSARTMRRSRHTRNAGMPTTAADRQATSPRMAISPKLRSA